MRGLAAANSMCWWNGMGVGRRTDQGWEGGGFSAITSNPLPGIDTPVQVHVDIPQLSRWHSYKKPSPARVLEASRSQTPPRDTAGPTLALVYCCARSYDWAASGAVSSALLKHTSHTHREEEGSNCVWRYCVETSEGHWRVWHQSFAFRKLILPTQDSRDVARVTNHPCCSFWRVYCWKALFPFWKLWKLHYHLSRKQTLFKSGGLNSQGQLRSRAGLL